MAISLKHKDPVGKLTRDFWKAPDTHEIDVPHDALSGVTANQHHNRYTDSEAVTAAKADADIADAVAKKHSNSLDHSNALDHSHSNKALLDTYTQAEADLADAVSKKHAQAHTHPESEVINLVADLAKNENVVVKQSDTSNSTTNLADAVGLSFTALPGKTYIIEAWIRYATSATTVGIQLSANGPASPAFICGLWDVNAAQGTPDGGAFNAYDVKVASSAAPFTTDNLARMHCLFRCGASGGDFIIRFCAETTGTITIKAGSVLRYRQVD